MASGEFEKVGLGPPNFLGKSSMYRCKRIPCQHGMCGERYHRTGRTRRCQILTPSSEVIHISIDEKYPIDGKLDPYKLDLMARWGATIMCAPMVTPLWKFTMSVTDKTYRL
ncbi:MAG: hypothetical protein IPN49_13345 [Saprospiraceae bacterium]|nr:hypothetical protein [Saprospiraceae bacterium]